MALPLSLDLCLVLALSAVWLSGLATRSASAALLLVLAWRYFGSSTPKENGTKHREAKERRAKPLPGGGAAVCGTFVPSNGFLEFAKDEPYTTENENCKCTCYVLWRPTDDPAREAAGDYPNADHFNGKKRLWEIRWQIRVKRTPRRKLVFGLELSQYVPVSGWAKRIQEMTVTTLRQVVGKDLYHSCGEEPSTDDATEAERPVFVMPLWAFDQLIVSEPGQEPDIRHIESLGVLRTSGRAEFIRQLSSLELQPDKVYTFAFWCISRFVDVVQWQMMAVVPGGVSFNTFCGSPPVHVVIYEFDDEAGGKDKRHLRGRKTYYFNMALWSTKDTPKPEVLKALLPEASKQVKLEKVAKESNGAGWCCWR